jgi:ribosomal protein S10
MRKVMSEDFMTTYMLDAIEDGGMAFMRSLGEEWSPLIPILEDMSLNERRSFCCKILYQRMKEVKLEELERSINEIKSFTRITPNLNPEQRTKLQTQEEFDKDLSEDVKAAYMAPRRLRPPHGITVAQLQIRGHYCPPVDFMADFCVRAAYHFGLPCTGPVPLPRKIERWTMVRSPFIFKKHQENFERRTYSRLVTVKDGNPDVVEMWISYCVDNQFHGTGMKLNLFTHDYVGVGKTMSDDIKQLIERDRWSIDGYNQMHDDAKRLQSTIDREIARIEGEISTRDSTERARRILQLRVKEVLKLEDVAEKETKKAMEQVPAAELELLRDEDVKEMRSTKRTEAMQSLTKRLPALDADVLDQEIEWDKQQDDALRKHLLHVGMYAQQKGVAPLTREEYFVYVPHVLLPKYQGIHKDVFELVAEKDLLRIPTEDSGYLAEWDTLTERERFDLIVNHRRPGADEDRPFEGDKKDTSRLGRLIEKRRSRDQSIRVGPEMLELGSASVTNTNMDSASVNASGENVTTAEKEETSEEIRGPEAMEGEDFLIDLKSSVDSQNPPNDSPSEGVEPTEPEVKGPEPLEGEEFPMDPQSPVESEHAAEAEGASDAIESESPGEGAEVKEDKNASEELDQKS